MTSGEPLFRSTHQALLFAFTYSENQHGVAAAAERLIASFGRDRYERLHAVASSRGLKGLDGAAQAGMIRRVVEELPALQHLAIEARFDVLRPRAQALAFRLLAVGLRRSPISSPLRALPPQVLAALVRRHYAGGVQLVHLGDRHDIPERTLMRRWVELRRAARAIDQTSLDRVEEALQERGIVDG